MSRYKASLKSSASDELLNTYLIRPLAWLLVLPLLRTPLRPEAIIALNIALALTSAAFFLQGTPSGNLIAGLLLLAKILFDAVDGQLARAKGLVTRLGRFLDSLADFYTNLPIFIAIGAAGLSESHNWTRLWLWFACFWVMTLQCSYFNFYLVAHLRVVGRQPASRTDERILAADQEQAGLVLWLQKLYLWTYGWQDSLIARVDRWSGAEHLTGQAKDAWYVDGAAVRLSSFLGLGTLLTPLGVLALVDRVDWYLFFILGAGNIILLASIGYRLGLARRLSRSS